MTSTRSYLDHNATSPLRPEAREAMLAALDCAGNPSSIHAEGRAARAIVERARETVARLFDAKPSQVYFTSGGTEAANWLLRPTAPGQKLALSPIEHPCVLQGHAFAAENVREAAVSADGLIDPVRLSGAFVDGAVLVAAQAANNETGVIQRVGEIVEIARSHGARIVCDAVQAIGRIDHSELRGVDALFFSAHKFGGPKGVGAVVYYGDKFTAQPFIRGGGQEKRQRSGTENVAGIAGLAAALDVALTDREAFAKRTSAMQAALEAGLRATAPDAVIFGENTRRLSNTTYFAIPGLRAETFLIDFDLHGIAVSSGSACSSGKVTRSHALAAMGTADFLSDCAIRVSTGWNTKEADIERFLTVLTKICKRREARAA